MNNGRQVHFASLMDLCHLLKNTKVESYSQEILWRMIQDHTKYSLHKDHQQHKWQPQKSWTLLQDYQDAQDKQQMQYQLIPRSKMKDAPTLLKIPKSECPDIWIRLPKHKWPKSWSTMEDPVVPLERDLCGHPLAGLWWERQFEKVLFEHGWEQVPNWECSFVDQEKGLFLSVYVDDYQTGWKETQCQTDLENTNVQTLIWENQHHSSTRFIWVALTMSDQQGYMDNYRSMFESRISAGATEKIPETKSTGKPDAETISSWSYDLEGNTKNCVGRYCELANKTPEQFFKVATQCMDDQHFREEEMKSVGEFSTVCSQIVLKCQELARIGRLDILWSVNKLARAVTKWTKHVKNVWRVWSLTIITHVNTCNIVVCETQHNNARLWLCWRPWRLEINIRRNFVHFRKPNICAKKLDVQETDFCFTQFYRSWGDLSRCRFMHGWDSRSRSWRFSDWSISFFTKPNQQKTKDLREPTEKPVSNSQVKHAKTNSNHKHQSQIW